jgi:predicted DNA-binding transcriptional regulator AlpA
MRYLITPEAAAMNRSSTRTIHELARQGKIPHRRISGTRRCLFVEEEIAAWLNGAELERIDLPGGGRIVRPVERVP